LAAKVAAAGAATVPPEVDNGFRITKLAAVEVLWMYATWSPAKSMMGERVALDAVPLLVL